MIPLFEKLYKGNEESFYHMLEEGILQEKRMFLVTANPEVFSRSEQDVVLRQAMLDDETIITPDGEGIVKAARMLKYDIWGKIAGVDTVSHLFQFCHEQHKSVYFYGSREEVLTALRLRLAEQYPNLVIAGMKNGYDAKEEDVFQDMLDKKPDVILCALGVPRQELAIYRHFHEFDKGLFIGVGGSLDVLSGTKKRAPTFFIKCKMEWFYRLMKEPKRIKKFYETHILFIFKIKKLKKEG